MAELLFYLLSAGAIGFGAGVVALRNPLFSVLSLLGSFVCLAGIYLVAGFQFLAAAQLLVYAGAGMVLFLTLIGVSLRDLGRTRRRWVVERAAGAVMVLFLFAVMLLNLGDEAAEAEQQRARPLGPVAALGPKRVAFIGTAVLGLGLVGLIASTGGTASAAGAVPPVPLDDLASIASLLFSRYALVFQAAGVLLLIAMVAVIVLAKRHGTSLRRERPGAESATPHNELSLGDRQP